jgi:DNA repair exonuclease SbcCD ATPase subunit
MNKDIRFFSDHDNCPTCAQGIDHVFKADTITSRTAKLTEIKGALVALESQITETTARLHEIDKTNREIMRINEQVSTNNQQIKFSNRSISELNDDIAALNKQATKIELDVDDTSSYTKDLVELKRKKEAILITRSLHEVGSHLLKDTGIKTKIISQYVPIMNKLINKYLAAMDFFVDFELNESFSETIRSRGRDEFTYASFSEGEKMRIDLALMFTWRAIAKMRNSASTNILIMDEVFDSSLDGPGTEEFLKILEGLTQDSNVFVISHKGDQLYDKFHSVIKFEKHANFSRMST